MIEIFMIVYDGIVFIIVFVIICEMMRLIVLKILYIKILKIGCVGEILDLLRRTPYFILGIK